MPEVVLMDAGMVGVVSLGVVPVSWVAAQLKKISKTYITDLNQ